MRFFVALWAFGAAVRSFVVGLVLLVWLVFMAVHLLR